ncbi:MAG: hypothetical protein KQH57_18240 [Actinomycetales bacterium]|nr:hypothetical protein [Actinomycetales bacterium]
MTPTPASSSSTTIDLTAELLGALEFAATLPCEHRGHAMAHADEPARWQVRTHCPHCSRGGRYLLCESGRRHMQWPANLGCVWCGAVGHWEDFVVACVALPEAGTH